MTREEALQAIKEKIAYYENDKRLKGAIETLIPELKESEDERIKKTITDSVFYLYGAGVEYKDVLDYLDKLEKQKEQKPRKFKLGDKVHWHDDDTNVITITGFREDAYLTDSAYGPILFCDEDNWERKEQKSSHKFNVGDTIHCKYDDREFTIKSVDLTNMVYKYTKDGCGNDIDYADEEFELVEKNPVEWSEEDEKIITIIHHLLFEHAFENGGVDVNGDYCKDVYQEADDFLKSLRPQPKQDVLPSLSEKEIICLKRALDYLRKEHNRYGGEDFTNEIAVLEWLITHPILVSDTHWKPSEDQMKALERASTNEYLSAKQFDILVSLYEQLKKLM